MYLRHGVVGDCWCGLAALAQDDPQGATASSAGRPAHASSTAASPAIGTWSLCVAYALATARRDQDRRVIRVPGYHTRGRGPADLAIDILATHGGFQEAVLCAAEPFSQRRSDRQALRLSNEWLQPEFPSPDLEDPAEPGGAYAIYLYLTYGLSLEDEEQGRTFGERLYLQMGRAHEGSTVYGWCELCSVPLRIWRNCQTCFAAFFSGVGRDASQALDCDSAAHQQDLQSFVCADCQQWM